MATLNRGGIWADCSEVLIIREINDSSMPRAFLVTLPGTGSRLHELEDNFTTHLWTSSTVTALKSSNV